MLRHTCLPPHLHWHVVESIMTTWTIPKVNLKNGSKEDRQRWTSILAWQINAGKTWRNMCQMHWKQTVRGFWCTHTLGTGVTSIIHQYVQKPVESYSSSCAQSAQQLKLYQFRMAGVEKKLSDAIAAYVKNRKQEHKHFASTKHFKKNNTVELRLKIHKSANSHVL